VERLPEELLVAVVPGTKNLFTYQSPEAVDPEGTRVKMDLRFENIITDSTVSNIRVYPSDDGVTFIIEASSFTPEGSYPLMIVLYDADGASMTYTMNVVVRYVDIVNNPPYFVEALPEVANLMIDYTSDPVVVRSFTTPKALDEEGDMIYLSLSTGGAPFSISDGSMNDNREWTWEIAPTPNAVESGLYKAALTLSNYQTRSFNTDGKIYSMIFNLTVIREPNEPPYFVEPLPENITFDFTSDST